jgi:hypothetical protein
MSGSLKETALCYVRISLSVIGLTLIISTVMELRESYAALGEYRQKTDQLLDEVLAATGDDSELRYNGKIELHTWRFFVSNDLMPMSEVNWRLGIGAGLIIAELLLTLIYGRKSREADESLLVCEATKDREEGSGDQDKPASRPKLKFE